MRDAMRATEASGEDYASSSSYAHFLRSRLLHYEGEHHESLDELRLALVSDEGNPFLLTSLAEEYARLGDLSRAEQTLKRVLESAPKYARAHFLLGRVLTEGRKLGRARVHLKRAIQLSPEDADSHLALAQVEIDARRFDDAIAVVETMARTLPESSRGFRVLGAVFAEHGDRPRAERMFLRAVQVFPGDYEAWSMLAHLRENGGQYAEAEAAYTEALQRDPDNLELLLSAGRTALRMGGESRASAWFDRALAATDDPEIAVRVSFAYLSEERLEPATEVLDRARRRNVGDGKLSFYAGLMHERLHAFDKAVAAYAEVPATNDLYPEAQVRRAGALSLGGHHHKALEAFRAQLRERPDYLVIYTQYARALERSGSPNDAERVLREAIARWDAPELYEALTSNLQLQDRSQDAVRVLEGAMLKKPEDVAIRFLLGAAYEQSGDVDRCLSHMRALLASNPDNAAALNFIGYVLADHGRDYDEAERLVKRALQLKPDSGAFLDSLGWVYFRRGETSKAVEVLEKAAQLEPDEPVIIEHLGDAYHRADRKSEALRTWKRALNALDSADSPANARKQRQELERKLRELSTESAVR